MSPTLISIFVSGEDRLQDTDILGKFWIIAKARDMKTRLK
jgi:hypothetical protein